MEQNLGENQAQASKGPLPPLTQDAFPQQYFYRAGPVCTLYKCTKLLQVPSNLAWKLYLDVSCVGEELQTRCLPACNIALDTYLAKDKRMLGSEIECLGEYQEEFLGKGSGEQHNWFSPRLQCVHENPSGGNPQGPVVSNSNHPILPLSGRLQVHRCWPPGHCPPGQTLP